MSSENRKMRCMEEYLKEVIEQMKRDYKFIGEERDVTFFFFFYSDMVALNIINKGELRYFVDAYGWFLVNDTILFYKGKNDCILMQEVEKRGVFIER